MLSQNRAELITFRTTVCRTTTTEPNGWTNSETVIQLIPAQMLLLPKIAFLKILDNWLPFSVSHEINKNYNNILLLQYRLAEIYSV